jgi:glycosyltransferase involved in cell wall biosynthesis
MKKRVLFVVDTPGWAYDDAAKNWKMLLKNEYDIDIFYLNKYKPIRVGHKMHRLIKEYQSQAIKGKQANVQDMITELDLFQDREGEKNAKPLFNHNQYDGIYFFYHRALCDARLLATPIPMKKVAIAINNEKWVQIGPKKELETYMKGVKVLVGCNNFILNHFQKLHPKVMRASQCINPSVFHYDRDTFTTKRTGENMVVGWTGNFNNKIKNFDIVRKACLMSDVTLIKARDLNRRELNKWYNEVDAVVIASRSEGGPLMLLEAGAVGIPVITVPVGLSREIIEHNKTGMLTKWQPQSIASAINILSVKRSNRERLGRALQKEVLENWTYEARLDEIRAVLKELCG